jgi:hypothetical protein
MHLGVVPLIVRYVSDGGDGSSVCSMGTYDQCVHCLSSLSRISSQSSSCSAALRSSGVTQEIVLSIKGKTITVRL